MEWLGKLFPFERRGRIFFLLERFKRDGGSLKLLRGLE